MSCLRQKYVPSSTKIEFIQKLSKTGLSVVEVTAFVSPKWVPQMGDHSEVFTAVNKKLATTTSINYPVLVPNARGMSCDVLSPSLVRVVCVVNCFRYGFPSTRV